MGSAYGFWRVAAFTSAEIEPAIAMGLLGMTDLLALNRDEAAAVVGTRFRSEKGSALPIVEAALAQLKKINPALMVVITAGKDGSWSWDGVTLKQVPALPAGLVSTAGAGDAFLAGLIVGKVAGLDLGESQEFATLVAAHSVTSPHTIDPLLDRRSLNRFVTENKLAFPGRILQILQDN